MKRLNSKWMAVLVASGMLMGCNVEPQVVREPLKFAWIPKDTNTIFETGRDGSSLHATELTQTTKYDVTVEHLIQDGQPTSLMQKAIDDKVNGIAISPASGTAQNEMIDKAVAAGIPVMTWDSDAPLSKRFTYYSVDNLAAGKLAADLLAKSLNNTGTVAILTGDDSQNLNDRMKAFRDQMAAKYSGITVLPDFLRCKAAELATCSQGFETYAAANPSINGWFFAAVWKRILIDEQAKDTTKVLMPTWRSKSLSGAYKTVAFDALKVAIPLLDQARTTDGKVQALIAQKYWGWGYDTIGILFDKVVNKKEFGTFVESGFDVVCPNNADAMAAGWASNDFSQALAKCSLLP